MATPCEWESGFGSCTREADGTYRTPAPHSLDPDGLRRTLCGYHGSQVLRVGGRRDNQA